MKNRSFTLIELLIVIVIIGLLASLAKPHLDAMVINAQGAAAMQDLDTIANSLWRYHMETGDFPRTIFNEIGQFVTVPVPFEKLDIKIATNKIWTYDYASSIEGNSVVVALTAQINRATESLPSGAKCIFRTSITNDLSRQPPEDEIFRVRLDEQFYRCYSHVKIYKTSLGKLGYQTETCPGW